MSTYTIDNRPAPIEFNLRGNETERILQNAKNLLMCKMGEVPYDRYRGFDPTLFDLPLSRLSEVVLEEVDRVLLWEPRAEAIAADCSLDVDGNTIITVTIEIED